MERITTVFSLVCVMLSLQGCVFGARFMTEAEAPFPFNPGHAGNAYSYEVREKAEATKEDFIRAWGHPPLLITAAGGEAWVYPQKYWCGAVVILPFMLPRCRGHEKIFFEDGLAQRVVSLSPEAGFVIFILMPMGGGGAEAPETNRARAAVLSRREALCMERNAIIEEDIQSPANQESGGYPGILGIFNGFNEMTTRAQLNIKKAQLKIKCRREAANLDT